MADIILNLEDETVAITVTGEENPTLNINAPEEININVTDAGAPGNDGLPGVEWRGDWDNATPYVLKDGVYYQGSSFICIQGNTSQPPFEGSTYWDILAKKGEGATPRGAYDSGTAYVVDDIVESGGSSYRCISPTTGNAPPNATYWEIFVSKGDKGDQGDPGTGINWEGEYNPATAYVVNDAVFSNGSAFVCISPTTGNEPPNPTYWDRFTNGLRWRGAWSNAIAYNETDLAIEGGIVYICILGHTDEQPPNGTYWDVFSAKGDPGAAGADGNTIIYLTGADPGNGDGVDGDSAFRDDTKEFWANKGSVTPGEWTGITPVQMGASPNAVRLTVGSPNTQNPNNATPIAIEWRNTVFKDLGITHDTGSNQSRITIGTGRGGRYRIEAAINYDNVATIRTTLNLYFRKNGSGDLKAEGETWSGYNRDAAATDKSTAFISWEGELLAGDYIELMSAEGNVVGTASLMANSYINLSQITLLEVQAGGGSSYGWGAWTAIPTITAGWNDTHNAAEYRISDDGEDVELRGVLQRTGGASVVGATLPAAAYPPTGYNSPAFITANKSTLGSVYVQILTNGDIQFSGFSTNNFLELGGIKYQTSRT